jgi:hypothetical protein
MNMLVFCDLCGNDMTFSKEVGGILFQSKACCPSCAPNMEASAKKYGEEKFIRGRCPPDKSFANWVREDLRKG